ncbi:MAG: sulfotransferase family 2 domain-containing protein [Saprospiraceae bacterium]|nr:sulfotransferase family 2 domain-containing protein [Saprospiraceae bacterium]
MELSVVIIFHNNKREAQRSLFALSKQYQENIESLEYEVICIDSNSTEKLDPKDFSDLGSTFKFHDFKTDNPSPADALIFGVEQAISENLCIIIDGAHIITPNVINHFRTLSQINPNYFIYTHPFHLGEYYQNDNMTLGYNQDAEDKLLDSCDWKENGYNLFSISNFKQSNETFDQYIFESNCFFITKSNLTKIGGINEAFKSRGGGFINLDIFKNAVSNDDLQNYQLVGEASFHQFHGGTSTNESRVSELQIEFRNEYKKIKGHHYKSPVYDAIAYGCQLNPAQIRFYNLYSHNKLVNDLIKKNKQQEAIEVLNQLISLYPFKVEYKVQLIKLHTNLLQFEEAEAIIEDLLKTHPYNIKVLDASAKYYLARRDNENVKIYTSKIIEIDPLHLPSQLSLLKLYAQEGNEKEKEKTLIDILGFPEDRFKNSLVLQIAIYCVEHKFKKYSEQFYNICLPFKNEFDFLILKVLYDELHESEFDQAYLDKFISQHNLRNESSIKVTKLIKILFRMEQWDSGFQLCNLLKDYFPEEQVLNFLYGRYYYYQKEFDKAEEHLRMFLKAESNRFLFPNTHYLLSKIALKSKDYNTFHKHAKEAYKKIKNTKYGLNYVRSLQFLQNYKPAITELEKIKTFSNVDQGNVKEMILKNAIKISDLEIIKKYAPTDFDYSQLGSVDYKDDVFKPIIFTHIQKCGGTSFRRYLSNAALYSGVKGSQIHIPGQNGQSPNTNLITLNDDEIEDVIARNIKVLADHSTFRSDKVKKVVPNYLDAYNLTYLRHPIKRLYSSYYYFYFGKNFNKTEYNNININDLPANLLKKFIKENANVATAFISGKMWAPDLINIKPEDLTLAKANLEQFQFIGITEVSDISMKVFNKVKPDYFNSFVRNIPRINKGSQVQRERYPNEEIKKMLIKANRLDIKLYNLAINKFISKYKTYLNKEEILKIRSLKITDESLEQLYS